MHWQPFWDSFEAAVDTNRSLTGVQKLSYLRTQLQGEARHVIAGFPLTNTSYGESVLLLILLKERFGQSYKEIDKPLLISLALTRLPPVFVNFTTPLRTTYLQNWDKVKTHLVAC